MHSKNKHFKEDIYRIFVVYALIPISLVTVIIFGVVYLILNHTTPPRVEEKNFETQKKLEKILSYLESHNHYMRRREEFRNTKKIRNGYI